MDTVRQRLGLHAFLNPTNTLSYRTVSQQHKLLDELGRIVRLLEVGTNGLALLVDVEVQFLAVELHCTAFETTFAQALGQLIQRAQFCSVVAILTHENLLHLFVRIPSVTLNNGMGNMIVLDVGFFV